MKQTTMNRLMSVLFAGSALFATAGAAQAALVTGKLDPLFGGTSPLKGLYVTGTESFTIANACLGVTGFVSVTGSCGGQPAGMSFDGATLNFYLGSPSGALVGTAVFPAVPTTPTYPLVGMHIANGQVDGVQSYVTGQSGITYNGTYLLDIQFGYTDLTNVPGVGLFDGNTFTSIGQLAANSNTTLFASPVLIDPCGIGQLVATCVGRSSDALATTLTTLTTLATVPEPGSLALAFGALAAGAFVRRQRNRR